MYEIQLAPSAVKFLEQLYSSRKNLALRITTVIDELKRSPYLGKKLMGPLKDFRSLRVGDYRILYTIIENRILIRIISIGNRRDIYR